MSLRRYKFVILLMSSIPLIYSKRIITINLSDTMVTNIIIPDDNYTDLYQQAPTLLLQTHNTLRKNHKLPPLKLNTKLNSLSKEWAETLAKERKSYHKPNNEYGENIYWENYESGYHYPSAFVHIWYSEFRFFRRKIRFHELHRVSNFTQLMWRSTKKLGVAAATNDSFHEVYLVCMYDPPGNIVDEYLDNIDLDNFIPELELHLQNISSTRNVSIHLSTSLCSLWIIIFKYL